MLRHAAVVLFVTLAVAGGGILADDEQAPETPEELSRAASRAFGDDRDAEGRKLLRALLERFPDSKGVPEALWELAEHHDGTTAGRAEALGLLRRIVRDHPGSHYARWASGRAADIAGWRFTRFPDRLAPGARKLAVEPGDGPDVRTYRLYRLDPEALAAHWRQVTPWGERSVADYPVAGAPTEECDLDLRAWTRGELELEFPEPGIYEIEEEVEGFTSRSTIAVRTFGVGVRTAGDRGFVHVLDPWTGAPLAGAEVTVRQEDGAIEGVTDEGGLFLYPARSEAVVTATVGEESWSCLVDHEATPPESLVYLTTDRPIYRPGHTVHWKAVRRERDGAAISLSREETVRMSVRGPEGRTLWSRVLPWNEAGAVSGSFTLSDEPALGDYTVVCHVETDRWQSDLYYEWYEEEDEGPNHWRKTFRVAAYRKPVARVTVEPAGRAPDGKILARIRADHWFGGAVPGAAVAWTAVARYEGRSLWDPGFLSDPRAWFFVERPDPWGDDEWYWYDDEEYADGEGTTGEDGTLVVAFDPPEEGWYDRILVHAIVEDATGLVSESEGNALEVAGGSKITLVTPRIAAAPGERLDAQVRLAGPDGEPVAGAAVALSALVPTGPDEWEGVHRAEAVTDAEGRAAFAVAAPAAGKLRLKATSPGAGTVRRDLLVAYGEPDEEEVHGIGIRPDRYVYEPGETARLLVRSSMVPLDAVLVVEGATLHDVRPYRVEAPVAFLEVPIRPEHAPNLRVSLMAFRDGEFVGGSFELCVYPADRLLEVAVAADRGSYGPGETAAVTIECRGADGEPVAAEVEVAIVDEAVLALRPDRTEDVRTFFCPSFPEGGEGGLAEERWATRCFRSGWEEEVEAMPLFGKAEEGEQLLGGGAEEEGDAAQARKDFPDTLLYRAHARTGEDGRCRIEVETPGSLTTWRILARAAAGADRFGQGASSVLTTKPVVLRLAAPRVFTEGDEGNVVGVLRSDLPERAEFEVRFEADGLEADAPPRTLSLDPGEEARLEFPVRAVRAGTATIRAAAVSTGGSDAVEIGVPVQPRGVRTRVASTGRAEGKLSLALELPAGADPASASLTVLLTTPAEAIRETLPFLAGYPYGCVEQTMSRFLPSVVAAGAMKRLGLGDPELEAKLPDMVEKGLQRLYRFQHDDGGFGWWENDETDAFMTAYVVYGLATAREAGFAVDEVTLRRAVEALRELEAGAFGLYARVRAGDEVEGLAEFAPRDGEDRAWLVLAGRKDLAAGIGGPPADDGPDGIRAAALAVRALHAADPVDPGIALLVRWLLERRGGRGWHSTLDTAYVVYALAEVATPAAGRKVRLAVNGTEVAAPGASVAVPAALLRAGRNLVEIEADGGDELYATAVLSFLDRPEGGIPAKAGAFVVERWFERRSDGDRGEEWVPIEPGATIRTGEEVRVVFRVDAGADAEVDAEFVMIECPIPAGFEPAPEDPYEEYWWDSWYQRREVRDDRISVAARELYGREVFTYGLRATFAGEWRALPATAFEMYRPARGGRSAETLVRIE